MAIAQQLSIDTTNTAIDLANEMFGSGIQVLSATFNGLADATSIQAGIYSGALTSIPGISPTDTGVILSTGNVQSFAPYADGTTDTNRAAGTTTDTTGIDGDSQLNTLAGASTFDAAIFQASFIPDANFITLQFVFSSEEYLEYVSGGFNDAVGVWVNGVYAPVTPLAGGSAAIDTINLSQNPNLFLNNPANADPYNSEMDGLTRVLTVKAPVNAGQTNTIKIAIADAGDAAYDSNVLIMANSIQTMAIAVQDEVDMLQNSTRTIDVLSNDTDSTDGGLTITHINGTAVVPGGNVTLPSGEVVTLNTDGTLTIQTNAGTGASVFTYSVLDSAGNTDVGFVNLNVVSTLTPDGIVHGTTGGDLIQVGYLGDPDGDRVDNNDALGVGGTTGDGDYVLAKGGNDTIQSGAGNDIVYAGSGNDSVNTGAGNDYVSLGEGDDTLGTWSSDNGGDDTIDGDEGNDSIIGGAGNDIVYGGIGNDSLSGQHGSDTLFGGAGADSFWITDDHEADAVYGGDGVDQIAFGNFLTAAGITVTATGNDSGTYAFNATPGGFTQAQGSYDSVEAVGLTSFADTYNGAAATGDTTVDGGAGNDTMTGGASNDALYGGADSDILTSGGGADTLSGGFGADRLVYNSAFANGTAIGGADYDILDLSTYPNAVSVAFSGEGQGTVTDLVTGAILTFSEIEEIVQTPQSDVVDATADNGYTYIQTRDGNDLITGSAGDDIYDDEIGVPNGQGNDTFYGAGGNDVLWVGNDDDLAYGGTGNDFLGGEAGNDTLHGDDGNDTVDGYSGNDVLYGGAGTDTVNGQEGADTLDGGLGADSLSGGDGNDRIVVGANDSAFGGGDADVFDVDMLSGNTTIVGGETGTDSDTIQLGVPGTFHSVYTTYTGAESGTITLDGVTATFSEIETINYSWSTDVVDATALTTGINVNTSAGSDLILGGAGDDTIQAGWHFDTIEGGAGNDLIDANEGNDVIRFADGFGQDTVIAGDTWGMAVGGDWDLGDFSAVTTDLTVLLSGDEAGSATDGTNSVTFSGIEQVIAGSGDDTIDGTTATNAIHVTGGAGADVINGSAQADTLSGGDDADVLYGGAGDTVVGGEGVTTGTDNDTLVLNYADVESITYGGGNNEAGTVTFTAASGGGTLTFSEIENIAYIGPVDGTAGDDVMNIGFVDAQGDIIDGADGDIDTIFGHGGNDSINAGADTDLVYGGTGNDTVLGGGGNDTILGEDGADSLFGEDGNDTISGGDGADYVDGDAGSDSLTGDAGNDTLVGDDGNDTLSGGTGDDQIYASGGDNIASGDAGADQVFMGTGADTLYGGAGNDTMGGGAGNDLLYGDRIVFIPGENASPPGGAATSFTFQNNSTQTVTLYWVDTAGVLVSYGDFAPGTSGLQGTFVGHNWVIYDTATGTPLEYLGSPANGATVTYVDGNDFLSGDAGNDTLYGEAGNDALYGGDDADRLFGGAGNDTLGGDDGNDSLEGGDGNDSLMGGLGADTLLGGAGADTLDGGDGDDEIFAGEGNDLIDAGAGNDYVLGEGGADTIYGGAGNDTLLSRADSDLVYGGDGNDSMLGLTGNDTFFGGADSDTLFGGADDDLLAGDDGNDSIHGDDGNDVLQGGTGLDSLYGGIGNDTLDGGDDADELFGDAGSDSILGGAGADTAYGGADADTLAGGGDNDLLFGGADADLVQGDDGDDVLWGDQGADTLEGGDGNDTLIGGDFAGLDTSADQIYGGAGNDVVEAGAGDDTVDGGDGNDTIRGEAGDDSLSGGADRDLFVMATGGGTDTIAGGEAGDDFDTIDTTAVLSAVEVRFTGDEAGEFGDTGGTVGAVFTEIEALQLGAGNDTVDAAATTSGITVDAGAGDDLITGGAGADTLTGGLGGDTITGGAGNDVIDVGAGDGAEDLVVLADGSGNDTITGFAAPLDNGDGTFTGLDQLDVTGLTDANGAIVNTGDVTVSDDGAGNAVLTFPNGESITLLGVPVSAVSSPAQLAAMGIPVPDYVVEGTTGDDLIDGSYLGDPEGDMVDAGDNAAGTDDDVIDAGAGNDSVLAGAGNDTVFGGTGNDTLLGGAGDDVLLGGDGIDTLYGGDGNDSVDGGEGFGNLYGDAGNDTIVSGETANNLFGGTGDDLLLGNGGNDALYAQDGADTLYGGTGSDQLYGGNDNDLLSGGDGGDGLQGDAGNDTIFGDAGADFVYGGAGNDSIDGGADNDSIQGGTGSDTILGGTGDDSVSGDEGADLIYGGDGNDSLMGATQNDTLFGGIGNDTLDGGFENDLLVGGIGNDSMSGGADRDTFVLEDGFGIDTIIGGEDGQDFDTLDAGALTGGLVATFSGNEAGTLTSGADAATFSEIEAVQTGAGNDTIDASATTGGVTILTSGDGDDLLIGGSGDDVFGTGSGADTVDGGAGNDTYELGAGDGAADVVVFGDGDGADTVQGFESPIDNGDGTFTGRDLLDVSGLTDANGAPVNTGDVTVSDDGLGNAVLTFPNGESITLEGVPVSAVSSPAQLAAMGISLPDYVVEGTAGNDTIDGSYLGDPEGDMVDAGDNATGTDADVINAGAGDDSVLAGAGNDTVFGGTGADTLDGGAGNDSLEGGEGADSILGGDGNDTVRAGNGDDTVSGGAGDDSLFGFTGNDSVSGGDGNDLINTRAETGVGVPDRGYTGLYTGDADTANDLDTVDGGMGNDTILTGDDNDYVLGGAGNDSIDGGFDDDTLQGQAGNDTILGNEGRDFIEGGAGSDLIYGGLTLGEADALNLTDDVDLVTDNNMDTIFGGDGNDTIYGMDDADEIYGGSGNDLLDGGIDNDLLLGEAGVDTLIGGQGDDVLDGGSGDDSLSGGDGNDTLSGGDPADVPPALPPEYSALSGTSGSLTGTNGNAAFTQTTTSSTGDVFENTMTVAVPGGGSETLSGYQVGNGIPSEETHVHSFSQQVAGAQLRFAGINQAESVAIWLDGGRLDLNQAIADGIVSFAPGTGTPWQINEAGEISAAYDEFGVVQPAVLIINVPFQTLEVQNISPSGFGNGSLYELSVNTNPALVTEAGGNDTLDAGAGDDLVDGGDGNDSLLGGDGNDSVSGGVGNDTIGGGAGQDSILVSDDGGTDSILGGEGGPVDYDTLDLSGVSTATTVTYSGAEAGSLTYDSGDASFAEIERLQLGSGNDTVSAATNSGPVSVGGGDGADTLVLDGQAINVADIAFDDTVSGTFTPANGGAPIAFGPAETLLLSDVLATYKNGTLSVQGTDLSGTLGDVTFDSFEAAQFNVVCFVRGTRIKTDMGEVAIEDLLPGDRVLTLDNGYQPIRWIGSSQRQAVGHLAPIRITAGALGNDRDLLVSPQHRMLLRGWQASLMFGEAEVLVAAKALVNDHSIRVQEGGEVEYFHMLFDRHEIVFAEGALAESFHPGQQGWKALDAATRAEILDLFPELDHGGLDSYGPAARLSLKDYEGRILADTLLSRG